MPRRTRIVATLGPATDPPEVLRAIIEAGVNVARINFSHGAAEEHLTRVRNFRDASAALGYHTAVLADLPGPKLRVKITAPRVLKVDEEVGFSRASTPSSPDDIVITEPEVLGDVKAGQRLLLDDGRLQLVAILNHKERVIGRVTVGGTLLPNKGINLPDTPLTIAALTPRDRAAIAVAAQAGIDWVALSFVRNATAAAVLRYALAEHNINVPILAKIERPEALTHATGIIEAFDGIMVARGDLGVEIPPERVPTAQKQLIAQARALGKPVITATDMLDSMRGNPRPTRAEAGDVANAIYDGTDAVMLSGETAVGSYPVEAVNVMHRIALEAESNWEAFGRSGPLSRLYNPGGLIDDPVTISAVDLARDLKADALVTPTVSGRTSRLLARHRPTAPVVAPTTSEAVARQLALVWGLIPVVMPPIALGQARIEAALIAAFKAGAIREGQLVVILAGHSVEGAPRFPTVRVARIGAEGIPQTP